LVFDESHFETHGSRLDDRGSGSQGLKGGRRRQARKHYDGCENVFAQARARPAAVMRRPSCKRGTESSAVCLAVERFVTKRIGLFSLVEHPH
jgi:hypothetical protein